MEAADVRSADDYQEMRMLFKLDGLPSTADFPESGKVVPIFEVEKDADNDVLIFKDTSCFLAKKTFEGAEAAKRWPALIRGIDALESEDRSLPEGNLPNRTDKDGSKTSVAVKDF
jgi:hypothetical protein